MEPMWLIVLRVAERIVVYVGAIFTIYLGYSLYTRGISKGRGNLQAKTQWVQIILSGTGPGLFFMAFGAIILLIGLFTGGGKVDTTERDLEILDNIRRIEVEVYKQSNIDEYYKELKKKWDKFSELAEEPNNTAHEDQPKTNLSEPNRQ